MSSVHDRPPNTNFARYWHSALATNLQDYRRMREIAGATGLEQDEQYDVLMSNLEYCFLRARMYATKLNANCQDGNIDEIPEDLRAAQSEHIAAQRPDLVEMPNMDEFTRRFNETQTQGHSRTSLRVAVNVMSNIPLGKTLQLPPSTVFPDATRNVAGRGKSAAGPKADGGKSVAGQEPGLQTAPWRSGPRSSSTWWDMNWWSGWETNWRPSSWSQSARPRHGGRSQPYQSGPPAPANPRAVPKSAGPPLPPPAKAPPPRTKGSYAPSIPTPKLPIPKKAGSIIAATVAATAPSGADAYSLMNETTKIVIIIDSGAMSLSLTFLCSIVVGAIGLWFACHCMKKNTDVGEDAIPSDSGCQSTTVATQEDATPREQENSRPSESDLITQFIERYKLFSNEACEYACSSEDRTTPSCCMERFNDLMNLSPTELGAMIDKGKMLIPRNTGG